MLAVQKVNINVSLLFSGFNWWVHILQQFCSFFMRVKKINGRSENKNLFGLLTCTLLIKYATILINPGNVLSVTGTVKQPQRVRKLKTFIYVSATKRWILTERFIFNFLLVKLKGGLKLGVDRMEHECAGLGTCGKADLHGPLTMAEYFELGQRHLVGNAHRVRSLIPLVPDISHSVTDCNNKPVRNVQFFRLFLSNIFFLIFGCHTTHRSQPRFLETHTVGGKQGQRKLCSWSVVQVFIETWINEQVHLVK